MNILHKITLVNDTNSSLTFLTS